MKISMRSICFFSWQPRPMWLQVWAQKRSFLRFVGCLVELRNMVSQYEAEVLQATKENFYSVVARLQQRTD